MAIKLTWPADTKAWTTFLQASGLVPEVAARALYLAYYAEFYFGVRLVIESAYRSPAYQKQLQQRWDAGNRTGLTVRPADSSKHSEGRAFDVATDGPDPPQEIWASVGRLGEALGLRWGARFQNPDPVHFDF